MAGRPPALKYTTPGALPLTAPAISTSGVRAPYNVSEVYATSGIITNYAGNGTQGYSGDGGQATSAELEGPSGVTVGIR